MDFDYQKIKDEESRQREERISSLPALQPRPMPRPSIATETASAIHKPPIKPRRSIKCRPVTQPGSGESHSQTNQMENEERKRIAPSQVLKPAGPLDAQTPSLQAHNLLWFQRTQLPPWQPKPVSLWRHGFATRREAEQVLQDKQQGCYLLRLSESKVGFVLSYRGEDKCRHFLIEQECDEPGTEGYYIIAGENSRHNSLEGLINYYTHNPVGPFNETLTVPYVQTNDICEDKPKLEERNEAEIGEEKEASPPTSREHTPTAYTGNDVHAAPQYAVVRKVLRKTHSLSECITVSDMLPLVQENTDRGTKTENDTPEHVFGNIDTCVGENVDHPVDAPYARVNKPQRPAGPSSATIEVTDANVWGASAASDSQAFLNAPAAAEQKYWELEPMHTYEEALHTRPRDDQIDFCAVGRHRENARDTDSLANHVYSEVNIKGTRDDLIPASPPLRTGTAFISTPSSTGPGPRLPLRPARRPVIPSSTQNFGVSAMRNTPPYQPEQALAGNSESSIYEQIPERPNRSRPPLPPLNGKR